MSGRRGAVGVGGNEWEGGVGGGEQWEWEGMSGRGGVGGGEQWEW